MADYTTRYRCSREPSVLCSVRNEERKARKRCAYCGSAMWAERVRFGVFVHSSLSGSARYGATDAVSIHPRETSAEKSRLKLGDDYVVRPLRVTD